MKNTKTHDSKVGDIKMQEKGNQKSGPSPISYQTPMAPEVASHNMVSSDVSKHGDEVKHESHKDGYRMNPVKAETGVKNPAAGITGQIKPAATAPADSQKSGSSSLMHQQSTVTPEVPSSVRGSRDTSKHVSEVPHESHKDEYRRDQVKTRTGMKNPVPGITGKTEPDAKTPAAPVIT
jgi:hypothetical protein